MTEDEFFSKNFTLTCPVWLMVDLAQWGKGNETAGALKLLGGKPSLGRFLPVFLDALTADEIATEIHLTGCGAAEIATAERLCKILTLLLKITPEIPNAVVYFKKNKTRFYRFEDLREELESYRNN